MESTLISGQYTAADAEQILSNLFNVRAEFQLEKIDTNVLTEEDIEHSERCLNELATQVRGIRQYLRTYNGRHVRLVANLSLECCQEQPVDNTH